MRVLEGIKLVKGIPAVISAFREPRIRWEIAVDLVDGADGQPNVPLLSLPGVRPPPKAGTIPKVRGRMRSLH